MSVSVIDDCSRRHRLSQPAVNSANSPYLSLSQLCVPVSRSWFLAQGCLLLRADIKLTMCVEYELHPRADALFYVTDVVLPPIIFVVGVVGNLLLIVVLSSRSMRSDNAVYVFYSAVAVVDLMALFCAVPTFLRDADLLSLAVANSRSMAYAVWARRAVEPILRHTAGWLTATAVGMRCAAVRLDTVDGSSVLWTRISTSRVVAFVILVACVLLDFTRFLDAAVVELTNHCFVGVRLWSHNVTALGRRRFYAQLQPTVSTLVGEVLPLLLSLLFALILVVELLRCCRRTSPTDVRYDDDERDRRLSVTVLALSAAFIVLDGPTAALGLARVFYIRSSAATGSVHSHTLYSDLSLIARCSSLARCCLNCVVVAVVSYDFRKTVRRTFCCCCPAVDDVYFEPVACCRQQTDYDDLPKTLSLDQLDYRATVTRDSEAQNGRQVYRMEEQPQINDSSLWI